MLCSLVVFFFKQKTAYEMRISDWSSDVCSSDLGELETLAVDDHGIDLAGIERRRGTIGIAEGTSDILKLTRWAEARARRAEPRGDVAGIVQAVEEQVILDDRPGQLSDHLAPPVLIVLIVQFGRTS